MQGEDKREAVESYQKTISDAVDDGSGCAETWRSMNAVRDDETPSRRAVIKLLGSGVAATGLGALSGNATATPISDSQGTSGNFREITGAKARQLVATAIRSPEFKNLRRAIRVEKGYIPNPSDPTVIEVEDPTGEIHQIVGIDLDPRGTEEPASVVGADIALTLRSGDVVDANGGVVIAEGSPDESNVAIRADGGVSIAATVFTTADGSVESDASEVRLSPPATAENNDGISMAASLQCDVCKGVGNVICTVGCGVGIAVICAAAGIGSGGAGGVTCAVIAGTLCYIFTAGSERFTGASCNVDVGVEWACYYGGYCSSPP